MTRNRVFYSISHQLFLLGLPFDFAMLFLMAGSTTVVLSGRVGDDAIFASLVLIIFVFIFGFIKSKQDPQWLKIYFSLIKFKSQKKKAVFKKEVIYVS
ncbi:MAG: hypothetical protein HOM96_02350 [Rickettsiales bacterium]|jgi:hypothetical protein|nr:hypothetical protein [Rickettsiales bacterium]